MNAPDNGIKKMLEWLTDHVSVFKMQHNAHREFNMTVEQHLAHRGRIGDAPLFLDSGDRAACVESDQLWEMRIILPGGVVMDLAGSSLDACLDVGCKAVEQETISSLAA